MSFPSPLLNTQLLHWYLAAFLLGRQGLKVTYHSTYTPDFEEELTSWQQFYATFSR